MYIFGVWMGSLDRKQKRCCTSCSCVDRLTSLPDELLTRILSMLPTKDAAAAQVLSKKMRRAFCWITNVDFDNSPVSHCVEHQHLVERFSRFESFIDNVLHKLSQYQQPLTRFRLCLGADKTISYCYFDQNHTCKKACFPEPARLYAWISYPLAQFSLRELDLCFHVRNSSKFKLLPEIFAHQSLEVLKLDINLEINGNNEIPVICLPNLKHLHLRSLIFTEDDFVTRLVSNCPALEDLTITSCWWLKADGLIITSNSLRKFVFSIQKYHNEEKNSELVHIDTPNLQYFEYDDNLLAFNYIVNLTAVVKACIYVGRPLPFDSYETSFRKLLSFATASSNVKQLSLLGWSIQGFYYAAVLKEPVPLPMFGNLRTLKLGALCDFVCNAKWDIVLSLILHRSPLLEELVFLEGLFYWGDYTCNIHDPEYSDKANTIPSCCEFHLKRIRIYNCHGRDQELNMMKFLLGKASVLKEFIISSKRPKGILFDASKFDKLKNDLEEIPRASNSCSIIYSDDEPNYY